MRKILGAVTTVAALLVLSACSGDATTSSGVAAPSGRENTIVVGLTAEPDHINNAITSDQSGALLGMTALEGLVEWDRDGNIVPSLAESWDISEDGKTYTFHLREDVTFHDGESLTSEDVVFSLNNSWPMHPHGQQVSSMVSSIEALDDYTVEINLDSPYAPFLNSLIRGKASILPSHIYTVDNIVDNPANRAPIGTGPWVFDEWVTGESVSFTRNDDYWGTVPELESIMFRFVPDATTLTQAVTAGEIDFVMAFFVPYEQVDALASNEKIHLERNRVYSTLQYLEFNSRSGPLADENVRQALFMALNRDVVNDTVFDGLADPSVTFLDESLAWGRSDKAMYDDHYPFDPEKAGEILDQAGYPVGPDGTRFTLRYVFRPDADITTAGIGDVLKAQWADIGVKVELVSVESAVWLDLVWGKQDYDVMSVQLTTSGDPTLGVARMYLCNPENKNFQNGSGVCSEEEDALWDTVATATSQEDRAAALDSIWQMNIQSMHSFPIIDRSSFDVISTRFDNLEAFFDTPEHSSIYFQELTLK